MNLWSSLHDADTARRGRRERLGRTKTNWARWRGTRSRADVLAAAMAKRAGDWAPDDSTLFVSDPVSVAERRVGRRNLVLGLLAAAVVTAVRIALGW